MRKLAIGVALFAACLTAASAQTSPGLTTGQVPTATEWNGYFSSKQDYPLPSVVTAGTTGDSTHVPQITVDAKGRITSITSILITGGSGAVSSVFGRTGVVVATIGDYSFDLISGSVTLAQLPAIADNTLLGNTSGGSHVPAALAVNSGSNCGDSTHALKWTNDTGFGCQAITGSASAGGSDTQLQRNNGSALGGISGATTDGTAVTIASGDLKLSGSSSGTVTLNAPATGGGTLTLPAGTDTVAAIAAPQTFTNKSIAASEVNSGTLSASQMPALTGDVTTSSGAVATTLATVNANTGACGDATHVCQPTLDGKGRATAAAQVAITFPVASVSAGTANLVCSPTTGSVVCSTTYLIDARTTTTEAVNASDAGKLVTFSNSSAVAASIANATGSFGAGWSTELQNIGAGTVTLTPTTALVNGAATLVIPQNTGCTITSDGTNYQASACSALLLSTAHVWTAQQSNAVTPLSISTATFTPTGASNNYSLTLVHASCPCTLANPSATPVAGTSGVIIVKQSSTGSDTIGTWGSQYLYTGGTSSIALSTAANAIDTLSYYVIDSTHILLTTAALNATH